MPALVRLILLLPVLNEAVLVDVARDKLLLILLLHTAQSGGRGEVTLQLAPDLDLHAAVVVIGALLEVLLSLL